MSRFLINKSWLSYYCPTACFLNFLDKPVKVEIKSTNIVCIPHLKRGAQQLSADENSDLEKQVRFLYMSCLILLG
jgi:hypothetical protein